MSWKEKVFDVDQTEPFYSMLMSHIITMSYFCITIMSYITEKIRNTQRHTCGVEGHDLNPHRLLSALQTVHRDSLQSGLAR